MVFADMDEVRLAYSLGKVALHAQIKLQSWSDGWRNLKFLFKKRFGKTTPSS